MKAAARCCLCLVILLAGQLPTNVTQGEEWPQWRGPRGQGHAATSDLPLTWSETQNVAWKSKIPGRGWSSPVIAEGVVWMTTAMEEAASAEEKAKRLRTNTGSQPLTVSDRVSFHAIGVDLDTGQVLHNVELFHQEDPQWVHAINTYASPTPVISRGTLFCHFGTFGTAAVDAGKGKVLWTNRDHPIMHENGPGASPIVWEDLVIFHCDGSDRQFITALDRQTGEVVWKTDRSGKLHENVQLKKAYSTPVIMTVGGGDVLVSPAADWLYGYDLASGKELWKMNYGVLGFSIVARPVVRDDMLYLSTCYTDAQMLAVRLRGPAGTGSQQIVWRYKKQVPNVPSPLLVGDQLYFVSDNGIATCLDAASGALLWVKRLGGQFVASPLYAEGQIYFFNREGETFVVGADRDFRQVARNKLNSGIWASPAAVDRSLVVRTEEALYRLQRHDEGRQGGIE